MLSIIGFTRGNYVLVSMAMWLFLFGLWYNTSSVSLSVVSNNTRFLRGGSRSSGGSRSGGGSWRNHSGSSNRTRNNYNNRGWGTFGSVLALAAAAGLGMAFMALFFPAAVAGCMPCLAGLCCGAAAVGAMQSVNHQNNNHNNTNHYDNSNYHNGGPDYGWSKHDSDHQDEFERRQQDARDELQRADMSTFRADAPVDMTIHSGRYATAFCDPHSGQRHEATLDLSFRRSGEGSFVISGGGDDIDGRSTIEEGYVDRHGTVAWWRERLIDGDDVGMKLLSRGRFDFASHLHDSNHRPIFQGTWYADRTKLHGPYISFRKLDNQTHVVPPTNTFPQQPIHQQQQQQAPQSAYVKMDHNAYHNPTNYNPPPSMTTLPPPTAPPLESLVAESHHVHSIHPTTEHNHNVPVVSAQQVSTSNPPNVVPAVYALQEPLTTGPSQTAHSYHPTTTTTTPSTNTTTTTAGVALDYVPPPVVVPGQNVQK